MFNLNDIVRNNIKNLKPYSSARDDFSGEANVWIDANENPFNTGVNRYPDPHQRELKEMLSQIKGVKPENVFVGNGSDEIIDLLYRIVCEPGKANVVVMPPTYGMYAVSAEVNDVNIKRVFLKQDFTVDVNAVLEAVDINTRLIFICSPNNPTGTLVPRDIVETIASKFDGLVVVDEAYIDFAPAESAVSLIDRYPNIFVMQTLSKAWGLAGARVGVGIGSKELLAVMGKVKAPYNVNIISQQIALNTLSDMSSFNIKVETILEQREWLSGELAKLDIVEKVYPSAANFLLVRFKYMADVFQFLMDCGIVTRDRSREKWCDGCIRITVGTPEENEILVGALNQYIL
jgi:histidinol-phosphate aminotransferase